MFGGEIKQLHKKLQLPQRVVASAKRIQIPVIAGVLKTSENELVILWFADKIIAAIGNEKEFIVKAFKIVRQKVNEISQNFPKRI